MAALIVQVRANAASLGEKVRYLYNAVSSADGGLSDEADEWTFGEGLWGHSEAGVDAYLVDDQVEGNGVVAIRGRSLDSYLGELENRIAADARRRVE